MTDVTLGDAGGNERLAFIFNRTRVQPSGLAAEWVVPPDRLDQLEENALSEQFARTPYAVSFRRGDATFILVTLHILFGEASADRIPELQEIADIFWDWARRSNRWYHNLMWAPLKMRFFCGSIVGDVLTDPKHSLRSRGQLSSCMAYTLRCSVRRRLTTTEKSLFLERPLVSG